MAHWLVKTEPEKWSWNDQVKAGRTHWNGVRNAQALINMRAMAVGDEVMFYHSQVGKEIVGVCRVVRAFYPDPDDAKSGLVDLEAVRQLPRPVTLAELKANGSFDDLGLIRQSRLSVMPVSPAHWQAILKLANA
jgi:predicted RNA-binding protein with PUA-like domain